MFHKLFMMHWVFVSPLQGSNEWESVFRGFRCASPTAKFCRPDGAFDSYRPTSLRHCWTSKHGQARLAYSLWPWMEVMGCSSIRSRTSWRRARRWASVRVSAGRPSASRPPT